MRTFGGIECGKRISRIVGIYCGFRSINFHNFCMLAACLAPLSLSFSLSVDLLRFSFRQIGMSFHRNRSPCVRFEAPTVQNRKPASQQVDLNLKIPFSIYTLHFTENQSPKRAHRAHIHVLQSHTHTHTHPAVIVIIIMINNSSQCARAYTFCSSRRSMAYKYTYLSPVFIVLYWHSAI